MPDHHDDRSYGSLFDEHANPDQSMYSQKAPADNAPNPLRSPRLYCIHPDTQERLYLPPSYIVDPVDGDLVSMHSAMPKSIYRGRLYVSALGRNLASGEQYLEVTFEDHRGAHRVHASRLALARSRGVLELLATRGAPVHGSNAAKIAQYLVEFATHNAERLHERLISDRMGLVDGTVLITPHGSVGADVTFTGKRFERFALGQDEGAYERLLRQAATWSGAVIFWWTLGLTLASPLLRRVKPRRYPVSYIAGDSGVGKSTVTFFALGAWATPGEQPFTQQATDTTQAGFVQTLELLGGLPHLIDEAHTAKDPELLERVVYLFANGQSYARGHASSGMIGGNPLGGAVIMVGEARPAFVHAGSHNRLLLLNADEHPPLGRDAGKGTEEGQRRARLLEDAWECGVGHLGPKVAEVALRDWVGFEDRVKTLRAQDDLRDLRDWGHAVAVVQATLEVLFEQVLHLTPPEDVLTLPAQLARMLWAQRKDSNPAATAFDLVRLMLLQGERRRKHQGGQVQLHVQGEFAGWRTQTHWNVLSTAPVFLRRVGADAVQLHGQRWVERGWVEPDKEGKATRSVYNAERQMSSRALVIPREVIEDDFNSDADWNEV
ncbi:DUF927 domain-containing protein [Deinococcus pimensis]|uniref:DUF927 domain-containing protein n=1 Tax=Deinococcus pimensis TaxID=309888 RepID=UPI0004BAA9CE|nr:DUF927 domain-containing protein [Deinococcus pimensis]